MNTAHHGAPGWKAELAQVADRLSARIEAACLGLANVAARGLRKIGLHEAADLLSTPQKPAS
jgi:hypothetical protein